MGSASGPRLGVSLVGLALMASVLAGVAVDGGSWAAAEEMAPGELDAPLVCDGDDVPVFFTRTSRCTWRLGYQLLTV